MKNIPTILYCCFKYAMAPVRTCLAMVRMISVPSEQASMLRKNRRAKARAAIAATGVIQKRGLFIAIPCFRLRVDQAPYPDSADRHHE